MKNLFTNDQNAENQFLEKGYYIFDTNQKSLENIKNLRKQILEHIFLKYPKIKKKFKSEDNFFEKMHSYVTKKELNDFRLSVVDAINKNKKFSTNYYLAAKSGLDCLVGNEIAMQKKLNITIQMPKDKESNLPMHSDIYAGESPFEVVVWIPLMNIKANSQSMFITSPKFNKIINNDVTYKKNTTINNIYKKHKKKFKFLKINFGQILIFSPILLHGNIVNKTPFTRVALNCRFKSLLSPFDVFQKTHRNIPHFFKPLNIKPLTKIGFNFINTVEKKRDKR
jgi:sporadic carbohydrate cluster 2OG-Fe(II) oxygenase